MKSRLFSHPYRLLLLALFPLASFPWAGMAAAQTKQAFEIADYYRTAFLSAASVSPDGERIAFAVRRYSLDEGESWSELWTVKPDGSDLRQLTFAKKNDTDPLFFPDGKRLLFVSDRSGSSQLWIMPTDGGEPQRLTDFSLDVDAPLISPDGRLVAASVEVYPECGAKSDCNEKISDAREDGPLHAHVADDLLYRHWTSWSDGRRSHVLLFDAESGEALRDLTPGEWESPVFMLGGGRGYDFSPDSTELCFASDHDLEPATSTNADLWVVPVDGSAAPRNLTPGNGGWDGAPLYSPDGRYIAYRSQATPGYESALFRLALYERSTGEVRYLTDRATFDDWVDEMAWLPDSQALLLQAPRRGRTPLYRVAVGGGPPTEVLVDAQIDHWEIVPGGRDLVYVRRSVGEPSEIFRTTIAGGERTQLTHLNRELLEEVDVRPAEEMWVKGDGDYEVQVFIVKPHDFDPAKKYPLILNVHGGPQSQWTDSYRGDWQVYPGKGYVVAFANPTGSAGRGQDFVDAIGCDWGGRVYRDLMKVTDALERLPYVDGTRMGAMGWSYGGYMMMWFQGHTTRFKAQAAMMGVYDPRSMYGGTEELWFPEKDFCGTPWTSADYERWSPSAFAADFETPALVITGELDYRVPYTQSLQYFTALRRQGVPARLVVFPGSGHWPAWTDMALYYTAHLDWFHRYLGGGEAPWRLEDLLRNHVFHAQEAAQEGEGSTGDANEETGAEPDSRPSTTAP